MRLFECQACKSVIYFENGRCETCGHTLGYAPEAGQLCALEHDGDLWRPMGIDGPSRRFCANADYGVCNWLTPPDGGDAYCLACRHNEIIPAVADPANLASWRLIEQAKHRLFYSLLRLKLPLKTRVEEPMHGLAFRFLADPPDDSGQKVMTGHENGLITLALGEADAVERTRRRQEMGELYRTLLGHFRHEIGHHYWDLLVRDGGKLEACRALFGDDSVDYEEALKAHYANGAPADWQTRFVSTYASSHPWEDFAETWAHYLHIIDTLEMGAAFGIALKAQVDNSNGIEADLDFDAYGPGSAKRIIDAWLPFVFAMNNVSRAMGHADIYPFIIAPAVVEKIDFIHKLVHGALDATKVAGGVERAEARPEMALPPEPAFQRAHLAPEV